MHAKILRLLILILTLAVPSSAEQEVAVAQGSAATRINMLRLQRIEVIKALGAESAFQSPQAIEAALQAQVLKDERLVKLKGLNQQIQKIRTQELKKSLPPIEKSERYSRRYLENKAKIREYKGLLQQARQIQAPTEQTNALKLLQRRLYLQRSELVLRHQLLADGTFKSPQAMTKALSDSHPDPRVKALNRVKNQQASLNITRSQSAKVSALQRSVQTARSEGRLKPKRPAPKSKGTPISESQRYADRYHKTQSKIRQYKGLYQQAIQAKAPESKVRALKDVQRQLNLKRSELMLKHSLLNDGSFKSPQELGKAVSAKHSDSRVRALDKVLKAQNRLNITRSHGGQIRSLQQAVQAKAPAKPTPSRVPSNPDTPKKSISSPKAKAPKSGGFGRNNGPRAAESAKPTPKAAPKPTPKAALKPTPKAAPKATPKPTPKVTPKGTPKTASKVAPKPTPRPVSRSTPKPSAGAAGTKRAVGDALKQQINPIADDIKSGVKTNSWKDYFNSFKQSGNRVTDKVLKGKGDPSTNRDGYQVRRDSIVETLKGKITTLNDDIAAANQAGDADKASKLKSLKDTLDGEVRKAELGVRGAQMKTEITALKDHIKVLSKSGGDKQLVKTLKSQLKTKEAEFKKVTADSKATAKSYVRDGLHFAVISAATQGVLNLVRQVKDGEDINLGNAFNFVTKPDFVMGTAGAFAGGLLVQKGLATGMGKIAMASLQNMVPGPMKFVVQALPYTIGAMLGSDVATGNLGRHSVTDMVFNGVGGSIGMMLGSAVFPPVGSIIGSVLGSLAGDAIAKMVQGKGSQEVAMELLHEPSWLEIQKPEWVQTDQNDMAVAVHSGEGGPPSTNPMQSLSSLQRNAAQAETLSDLEQAKDQAYNSWKSISTHQGADTEAGRQAWSLYQDLRERIEQEKMGTVQGFGGF